MKSGLTAVRRLFVLKLAGALVLSGVLLGATTACGTVEGIGRDISALGRAGKRAFD